VISLLLLSSPLLATPEGITFQSRIIKPDNTPLESTSVDFRLSIMDSVGTCALYQEDFADQNMSGSKGLINLSLGSGSKIYPAGVFKISSAFNNFASPILNCQAGGSITAGPTDPRKLIMQFNDGSGWQTLPVMEINSNPFAMQAMRAYSLGDYPATDYLRTASLPTCGGSQALHFNGTSITCVATGGGGSVTQVTSANVDIGVSNTTTTPVLTLNVGTGANQIVKLDASSQLPAVSGVNVTNLNATNLASGTVPAAQMPALTGDVTMTAGTTSTTITGLARSKIAAGSNNHVLINDGSGNLSSESSLAVSRGGTGATSFIANRIVGTNVSGSALTSFTCGLNEVIKFDGSGDAFCGTDNTGSSGFADGGNTFTATAVLGTQSNHNLEIETNGTTKMTVLANGNVGIGTATPTGILQVDGGTAAASTNGSPVSITAQGGGSGNANGGVISLRAGDKSGTGVAGGVVVGDAVGYAATFSNYATLNVRPTNTVQAGLRITGLLSNTNDLIVLNASGGGYLGGVDYLGRASFNTLYGSYLASANLTLDSTSNSTKGFVLLNPSGGNVGIGTTTPAAKLEVNGDVKVGNSSAACSATTKGSIRYNDVSSVLEFCNGTAWSLVQAAACSDATPNVISFSNEANATISTLYTSDIQQVTGVNCSVPVTISGQGSPQYQICSDAACATVVQDWTSSPSSIITNQYMRTRLTTDTVGGAMFQATIIVGSGASVWSVTNAGGDCAGSPSIGTVCADGTIYAGLSPDGSVKMYTTRCDYGQTWDGFSCTGSRSSLQWNNGSTNWTSTFYTSVSAGKTNSAGIAAVVDAGSPYSAAANCESLVSNGNSDWYLPALEELNVLYTNRGAIRNFSTSFYWTSTEITDGRAYSIRFLDASYQSSWKNGGLPLRCVRR